MSRIGLIGSCVTRDVWNILNLPTANLKTISRTSLASLTAPAESYARPAGMGALDTDGFLARCVQADIEKTALQTLEAWQPDILIFDFIDERFDLLRTQNSLYCDSFEFRQSGLRALPPFIDGQRIRRLAPETDALWRAGLERLHTRITNGTLATATIILHAAYWAETYRQNDELRSFPQHARFHPVPRLPEPVSAHNDMLARYHQAFAETFPNAIVIEPPSILRIGDAGHPWGLSPHHYIPEYYGAFRQKILEVRKDFFL